jgi:hypothetical protein
MTMAYDKLDAYVAAYSRGASVDELAGLIGVGGMEASRTKRVRCFNQALVRLGVVHKRKQLLSDAERTRRREMLANGRAILAANRADYRAWKAQRAANSIAAE